MLASSSLAVALVAALGAASPADPEMSYRTWTTDDGLAQGSVYAIAQTPDGYLWIATLDGLVRFDGARMTTFSRSQYPELKSNRILALEVGRDGSLWIGTEDGGVARMKDGVFRAFGVADGLPGAFVPALLADTGGRVWAQTDGGLARFDGEGWAVPPDAALRPGDVPIAFGVGVLRDGGVRLIEHSGAIADYGAPAGIDLRKTTSARDPRGAFWFRVAPRTLLALENGTIARLEVPGGPERPGAPGRFAVARGAGGRTWVMLDGRLHLLVDGRWREFAAPVPAPAAEPIVLFEDREGSLWIGGETGLTQATPTPLRSLAHEGDRFENNFYPVAESSDGRLWAGSQSYTFVVDGDRFARLDLTPKWGVATALEPEADGSMLVATPGLGVLRVGPALRGAIVYRTDAGIADLLRDRSGALWLATNRGAVRVDGGRSTGFARGQGLADDRAEVLLEGADGAIWVGTRGGLSRIESGRVTTWTVADGLPSERIRALLEDDHGSLWIGTYDGGLARLAHGKIVAIRKVNGLGDDGVFAIVDDGMGRYWMSSNRGIHVVERAQLDAFADGRAPSVTSRSFGRADGMLSSECNGGFQPSGIRRRNGTLVFPTQRGLAIVDPRALRSNPAAPHVVIEAIASEAGPRPVADVNTHGPSERRLDVRFTAPTFIRPAQARFRYRLDKLDPDWTDGGAERSARYASIPPGSYVFRLIASNADGVWSEPGASFSVRVQPAWWQRNDVRGGAALALAGTIAFGVRRRFAAMKRRRTEQDHFAQALIESQEAERKRIAGELHDGIGQTLAVIRNRALIGLRDGPVSGRAQRQVEQIAEAATSAIDEIRKVTHNLRPYQIDRLGLARAIEAVVEQAAAAGEVDIDASIDPLDGVFPAEAEIGVYRIVQEAVSNVLRHAGASHATVAIRVEEKAVEIVVEDDGRGFDPAAMPGSRRGMGLSGIAERARILGGRHTLRSAPGRGTRVAVVLPRGGASA